MCGKYNPSITLPNASIGSPPHVREVLKFPLFCPVAVRITPACAGSTVQLLVCPATHEDHPRMCGKYPSIPTLDCI